MLCGKNRAGQICEQIFLVAMQSVGQEDNNNINFLSRARHLLLFNIFSLKMPFFTFSIVKLT